MAVLIDNSVLLAAFFAKDKNHDAARKALAELKGERIVPTPVVLELFQMTTARINYDRAIRVFESVQMGAFTIVPITSSDMTRMREIMRQYRSAEFDFADTALMALSERLNIRQIYTFDRRDFSQFRPTHCDYLDLLP